jgi:hypothetical protein
MDTSVTRRQRILHANLWPILAVVVTALLVAALVARDWRGV